MKAFIIKLEWIEDRTVVSHIVMFSPNSADACIAAARLHPEHKIIDAEEAPWLNPTAGFRSLFFAG